MIAKPHKAPPKRRTDLQAHIHRIGAENELRLIQHYRHMIKRGMEPSMDAQFWLKTKSRDWMN